MTTPTTAPTPALAAGRMARRLTAPFGRGADTIELQLVRHNSSQADVTPYDFSDHVARFDVLPQEPRYVLTTTRDIDADITVTLFYQEPGTPENTTTVTVPAGTVAGTSFLLDQPRTATARVFFLSMATPPFDNAPQDAWQITALLGTTAKLLWVVGAERDELRRHAVKTLAQRHLPTAVGLSLDLIGADLGVPRFPPLPYGFDTDTVALYHLDDAPGTTVVDATAAYPGRTGFGGTASASVQAGLPGRYGRAMGFPAADAVIEVTTGPAFDIGGGNLDGAAMECFVRPDPDPQVQDGPVLSWNPAAGPGQPGWVIAIGEFGRGIARNVRFTISDGTQTMDLFADLSLPTDSFTHVAAVIDRASGFITLYIDGVRQDQRFAFPLGAVASTAPLLIGAAGGGFRGTVDEVRISSAARAGFAPALGEADEHYRRRLELFRRWALPTPANLTALLNQLAGPIGGDPGALVVDDTNATLVRGTRLVRIRPQVLLSGESIDAAGRRGTAEASVVGTAATDDTFDPAFLFRYDRADVDFTPPPARTLQPGEQPPDPHLVHLGVAERLDRLITLAGAETGGSGRLLVDSGYDPRAADLRATGRAVVIGHSAVGPDRLSAVAHQAGFDFVVHRPGGTAAQVYAAIAPHDYFEIDVTPPGGGLTDLDAGSGVSLSLRPTVPADASVSWLIVPDGAGRGTLTPAGGTGSPQRTASLSATAPGQLIVKAEVTRGPHTVSATRALRVGLADLPPGGTITADGTQGVAASSLDRPDVFFHPVFLAQHDDPRVDYGSQDAHRMQPAVAELLDALLSELDRRTVTGRLAVAAGFDATAPPASAEGQGRRLVLSHGSLTPGALAGVAFAVGFSHLTHAGDTVEVRQAPGQLVMVRGPASVDASAIIELTEGGTMDLTASPPPDAVAGAGLVGKVPGQGPQLSWASGAFDDAVVTLGSNTQQAVTLNAGKAGMAWVQASYLVGGQPDPYTFQVRLRPELDTPQTVISKDQFDLIMNILNTLHPVGVEVLTAAIRAHVIELQGDQSPANPDYTYPKFRVRGTLPRQVKGPTSG